MTEAGTPGPAPAASAGREEGPPPAVGRRGEAVVPPGGAERLDAFLAGIAGPGLSRTAVQRLIREGRVRVDGAPARPAQRLRGGARVTWELPPPADPRPRPEAIPLDVVFEDEHLIVVNKPRGLVVHPAPGNPAGTLVNALLAHAGRLAGVGGVARPGIVHRLDKDTTGLMVAAKTDAAALGLARQIADRRVVRVYWALCHGQPPDRFTVDAPVGRDARQRQRMAVRVHGGRQAVTHFRVLERFPAGPTGSRDAPGDRPEHGGYALLEARLETGRTHQVRVHLAYAGHPVAGDRVYGGRAGELGLRGQALHAVRLAFVHPVTGEVLSFEAPPPEDFRNAVARLRGPGGGAPAVG
jgi:23S rRNA pseudouridine1911/1915/1917 synthase